MTLVSLPVVFGLLGLACALVSILFNLWAWARHRASDLAWYAFLQPGVSLRGKAWLKPAGRQARRLAERSVATALACFGVALLVRLFGLLVP